MVVSAKTILCGKAKSLNWVSVKKNGKTSLKMSDLMRMELTTMSSLQLLLIKEKSLMMKA